ncbi:hypothetical protein JYU29_17420 [Tianweitania sp. BSSL-BM11]|uniref:Uncharacterized protein n=1 Tax=Tianweitania aestuarii TaxID=2814886 RepID=A0ABS5S1Q5_9HYPH|nr:hypothetical protein [Tianweitania aestuarii]MBS9722477.1 hypothetical protein [Tianweitania aestuarii]
MKTKLLALALAASMTAGAAYAQTAIETPTQSGGSEATTENTGKGVPELPGETVGNKSDGTAVAPAIPSDAVVGSFYTDSSMGTMKSDEEINTYWQGLTPEEQAAVRAGCTDEFTAQNKDLPESTLNVCKKVNGMM